MFLFLVSNHWAMMKRAFTLTELLVCVAIMGIMLSMVLPALGKARAKLRTAQCSGNLRGIGQGMAIYHTDQNELTMPASFGETDEGYVNHFINYMISRMDFPESTFQCPSMDEEAMFDPDGHDPSTGNIYTKASYIMNIIKMGNWNGADIPSRNSAHGWGLDSVTPIALGRITNPSSKIHIVDVVPNIANSHSGINYFDRSDHGQANFPPTGFSRWVGNSHQNGYNALFGDGHIKPQKFSTGLDWAVNR
jgi:prepilin-type N-terminal cleavage/methylation domain-containing protein/prepilin-type processing-associated H-X9-DG protein